MSCEVPFCTFTYFQSRRFPGWATWATNLHYRPLSRTVLFPEPWMPPIIRSLSYQAWAGWARTSSPPEMRRTCYDWEFSSLVWSSHVKSSLWLLRQSKWHGYWFFCAHFKSQDYWPRRTPVSMPVLAVRTLHLHLQRCSSVLLLQNH